MFHVKQSKLDSLLTFAGVRVGGAYQSPEMMAGTELPSPPLPTKVANKQQVYPSHVKTTKPNTDQPLLRTDRGLINTDITSYRVNPDTRETIRNFTRTSPDLSAAVTAYVRIGITSGYVATAHNLDGTVNPEATNALAQVLTRLNVLSDPTIGYDDAPGIREISEAWARQLVDSGAAAGELVLDKARMPDKVQPIAVQQIRLFPSTDSKKLIPKQFIAGEYIDLDIPTFFMTRLDQDLLEPYPISPIEPAVQAVLFSADFMNDIRRVVKRSIHPRLDVVLNEDKFRKAIPQEYLQDAEKLHTYMASFVASIEQSIQGLRPEDALVHFDTVGFAVIDHGNTQLSKEYEVIQEMADSKLASGAKVLPTVLGHSNGTSNTASAEVLLFMKNVEGTIWAKLNDMWSRVLTLALRLLGHDVYVSFRYNAIDLRPEAELEAFKAMKQSRFLTLLSLGLVTDEEAGIELTGHLPPAGYTPLSGTGFMPNTGAEPTGDGFNGASNSGSTTNQANKSDAPRNPKSANKGKPGAKAEVIPIGGVL